MRKKKNTSWVISSWVTNTYVIGIVRETGRRITNEILEVKELRYYFPQKNLFTFKKCINIFLFVFFVAPISGLYL